MRVLARSRSDGLLSLWSLTNGNFHDSFETESKVKNFIDPPSVECRFSLALVLNEIHRDKAKRLSQTLLDDL